LILISTVVDYIGGLGVAGVRLAANRLLALGTLIVGSAFFLCTSIDYRQLAEAHISADAGRLIASMPCTLRDYWIVIAAAAVTASYGACLPFLHRLPDTVRRRTFLTISMVANLAILGFFKYYKDYAETVHASQPRTASKTAAGPRTFKVLDRFVALAQAHESRVCFVAFPMRRLGSEVPYEIHAEALRLIGEGGMKLLDLRTLPDLLPEHYADEIHLTPAGADIYTRRFTRAFGAMRNADR
jgi:hypothetical protein